MPKSLEPSVLHPIVLDCDKDKPAEIRPTFFARALSMREQVVLGEELDAAVEKDGNQAIFDAVCELLQKYVGDWKNMGTLEFGKTDLQSLLSYDEARELLRKVYANSHVSGDEKKG